MNISATVSSIFGKNVLYIEFFSAAINLLNTIYTKPSSIGGYAFLKIKMCGERGLNYIVRKILLRELGSAGA